MTFEEYEREVRRTFNSSLCSADKVHNMVYGLSGEMGEVVERFLRPIS